MTSTVCTNNNNIQRLVVYLSCLLLCLTGETAVSGFGRFPTTSIIQKSPIPWEYYRLGPKNNKSSSSSSSSSSAASKSSRSSSSSSNNKKSIDDEIREMEQQVLSSAREKRDFDRVALALREDQEALASKQPSLLLPSNKTPPFFLTPEERATTTAQSQQLQVALASTVVTAVVSFLLFSNVFITAILSALVFWSANSDPLENKDNDENENLVGAIARMVGRSTLQSYQQTTPKVKAVARAVVGTSEKEMALLKARIQELEQDKVVVRLQQRIEQLQVENAALQVYKQQREQVDQHGNRFKLPELKQVARDYNLPVSGTKDQVLMRLVQAGAIDLEES